MRSDMFSQVIKSMIKTSGGSVNKTHLDKYLELIEECFMYNPCNFWLGTIIEKSPLDLMIFQEIIFEKRPNTIIECGTGCGGLAYFLATLMDLMNIDGKIITIDHHEKPPLEPYPKKDLVTIDGKAVTVNVNFHQSQKRPKHPKIEYIHSDCLTADIPKLGTKTMVILDSDNSADYVYQELERFSPLVSLGQYIIIENTIASDKRNGPAGAVKKFLKKNKHFVADHNREKFEITSKPGGYLLKTAQTPSKKQ